MTFMEGFVEGEVLGPEAGWLAWAGEKEEAKNVGRLGEEIREPLV